jgi:hypothetical protein
MKARAAGVALRIRNRTVSPICHIGRMPKQFHGRPYWNNPDDNGIGEYTLFDESPRLTFTITWNHTKYSGALALEPDGRYRGDFVFNDGSGEKTGTAWCILKGYPGGYTLLGGWRQLGHRAYQWHDDLT